MIVAEQLVQEVNCFGADESLVVLVDKALPALPRKSAEYVVVLGVKFNVVLVQIFKELVRTENLGNLDKLICVAVAVEEGLFPEDHGSKHGPQ